MDRWRLPLNALRAFDAVAQTGSFRGAAAALGTTQSAISAHVAKLETQIGVTLFERAGRPTVPTAAGATLVPVVARALDEMSRALDALDASRVLKVHVPPAFLDEGVLALIGEFRRAHPALAIELASGNTTGEPETGADVAIVFDHAGSAHPGDVLLRRVLFTPLCVAVAGPAPGEALADFVRRSDLLHVRLSGLPDTILWQRFAAATALSFTPRAGVTFPTAASAAAYAASGTGVMLGEPRAALNGLIAPFPDAVVDLGFGYYLRARADALARAPVARLNRWLVERLTDPACRTTPAHERAAP